MTKHWKDIKDYKGLYQISNSGQVRRIWKNHTRTLKPGCWNQYLCVHLWRQNRQTTYKIHTLVLNNFVGLCPAGMECRHLDGNPKNNKLNNLKWGTRSENQRDAVKHGTSSQPDNSGSKNGHAKLTEIQVVKINNLLTEGKSHVCISKMFCVSRKTVYDIDNGLTWRHI